MAAVRGFAIGVVGMVKLREVLMHVVPDKAAQAPAYVPPLSVIMAGLGTTAVDLGMADTVTVSAQYLTFLLRRLLSDGVAVDQAWYQDRYLDIRGAVMAGQVASPEAHYRGTGWLEGRLPHEVAFDAAWYYGHYDDLHAVFDADDVDGLRYHFYTRGYFEGRAGVATALDAAEAWRVGR